MTTDNTRALKKIDFAHIITLQASATCTAGTVCKMTGAMTIGDAAAGDDTVIGVTLGNVGVTYASGAKVQVYLPNPVVPMKVGTGGTTRGQKQKVVSDGITDAPATTNSGATTTPTVGIALETGVVGDYVGMILTFANRISA